MDAHVSAIAELLHTDATEEGYIPLLQKLWEQTRQRAQAEAASGDPVTALNSPLR
ncbi:hypothetical protein S7335_737 [Synechococcus sp. PCC 7335]|nr:hypothetical protein S7335_737 [Synechococcus sp. PCC 7335]